MLLELDLAAALVALKLGKRVELVALLTEALLFAARKLDGISCAVRQARAAPQAEAPQLRERHGTSWHQARGLPNHCASGATGFAC